VSYLLHDIVKSVIVHEPMQFLKLLHRYNPRWRIFNAVDAVAFSRDEVGLWSFADAVIIYTRKTRYGTVTREALVVEVKTGKNFDPAWIDELERHRYEVNKLRYRNTLVGRLIKGVDVVQAILLVRRNLLHKAQEEISKRRKWSTLRTAPIELLFSLVKQRLKEVLDLLYL